MNAVDLIHHAIELQKAGRMAEAIGAYREVIRRAPAIPNSYQNLAVALKETGLWDEARDVLEAGVKACPDDKKTRLALAHLVLAEGRYAEGWPLYESRIGVTVEAPGLAYPKWAGEALAGKSLLIWFEQGLGDQIQYARFVPRLVAQDARVTMLVPPPLGRLFSGLGAEVIVADGDVAIAKHDFWTLPCSIPGALGIPFEDYPAPPYLAASAGGQGGIGVMAQGNPKFANDAIRSLDAKSAHGLRALGRSLAPEDTGARDFQDTAEIVAGLDLVISVDTSVAHLAGAMGKPVWILLPALKTDWRWMRDRSDSPWYPAARLFRQSRPGDWGGVIDQIRAALAAQ